jgi:hypothetical protein
MLFIDPPKPDGFTKYVLPAVATLIPGAIAAASKWILDHSHKRRSAELTQRVSTLAKSISELPVLPLPSVNPTITPQSALTAELEAALNELTALQTRTGRSSSGVSSITSMIRSTFLLFRPKALRPGFCICASMRICLASFLSSPQAGAGMTCRKPGTQEPRHRTLYSICFSSSPCLASSEFRP